MPLFSVDYAYTHLASCREIGNCDIKVIQKQLVDPLTLFSWYVFNPSSTQNRGAKHHSRKKESALSFDQVEQMLFNFMKQKQTWKSNYIQQQDCFSFDYH